MASLRGSTTIWDATTGAAVAQNDPSSWAFVGSATNIAIYIKGGATAATFKIQVSGVTVKAGLNEINSGAGEDGGVDWYDYHDAATELSSLVVGVSGLECFNLHGFAPSLIRLVRTDAAAATTVQATIVTNGPN